MSGGSSAALGAAWRLGLLGLAAAVALGMLLAGPRAAAGQELTAEAARLALGRARETRAFTERTFQHLAGGPTCPEATYVSYAHSTTEPDAAVQWYQVSQIWADLALARPAEPLTRCWASRGFTFLDRLWDRSERVGGFLSRTNLDGEGAVDPTKWVDDNSLAGLVWIEGAESAPDRLERELLLGRARSTARFLMEGAVWDEMFGGGFWWNTERGATPEGKPAQTNGLAAAFFLRLYAMTGEPEYRQWATRTLGWLEARLYDPDRQLYRWGVHHADRERRNGEVVAERYFNYDQGILIEANLLAFRLLGRDPRYLTRARVLGERVGPTFWDRALGGYDLEAGVPQVFPVYSAWLTQSLLMLYEQDGDPTWLSQAASNVEALDRAAWDAANGGYFHRYYVCRDPSPPGCGGGAERAVDATEKHSVDQAWMQRALALLAAASPPRAPIQVPGGK